jgi:hypothetical protein
MPFVLVPAPVGSVLAASLIDSSIQSCIRPYTPGGDIMAEALPLPIRILVKGASTVGTASPMGGPRTDFTFPRAIEASLLAAGRPVEVRTISVASERTKDTLRHWEREMVGYSPDVVVLVYGHYETIHLMLPWWLERHANSLRSRPGRIRERYRKVLLRPFWMSLAKLQAKLDTTLDPNIRKSRPLRVAADLEKLIGRIRFMHSPLVFVFELQPPAKRFRSWFPGMTARMAVMNKTIAGMVERQDSPDIRYFRTTELIAEHAGGDLDLATPDGFHYTPEMHRVIGTELATAIMEWADTQEHLKHG